MLLIKDLKIIVEEENNIRKVGVVVERCQLYDRMLQRAGLSCRVRNRYGRCLVEVYSAIEPAENRA